MAMYKYISRFRRDNPEEAGELKRSRLIKWRREPSISKTNRPTQLDRARRLGYKSKQGISVFRVKVSRGARRKHRYEDRGEATRLFSGSGRFFDKQGPE